MKHFEKKCTTCRAVHICAHVRHFRLAARHDNKHLHLRWRKTQPRTFQMRLALSACIISLAAGCSVMEEPGCSYSGSPAVRGCVSTLVISGTVLPVEDVTPDSLLSMQQRVTVNVTAGAENLIDDYPWTCPCHDLVKQCIPAVHWTPAPLTQSQHTRPPSQQQ